MFKKDSYKNINSIKLVLKKILKNFKKYYVGY